MPAKKGKSKKEILPTITVMGIEFDFSKYSTWFILLAIIISTMITFGWIVL